MHCNRRQCSNSAAGSTVSLEKDLETKNKQRRITSLRLQCDTNEETKKCRRWVSNLQPAQDKSNNITTSKQVRVSTIPHRQSMFMVFAALNRNDRLCWISRVSFMLSKKTWNPKRTGCRGSRRAALNAHNPKEALKNALEKEQLIPRLKQKKQKNYLETWSFWGSNPRQQTKARWSWNNVRAPYPLS